MKLKNSEIAALLFQFADLLEAEGDNPYRVRAYRRAGRVVDKAVESLAELIDQGVDLTYLPNVGEGIAGSIQTIIKTGNMPVLKKRQIRDKPVADAPEKETQLRLFHAYPVIESLLKHIRALPNVVFVECAGSFRRRQEVVGKQYIIIHAKKNKDLLETCLSLFEVKVINVRKKNYAQVILWSGLQVEFHLVAKNAIATALLFYTGAEAHYTKLIKIAEKKHLTLTQKSLSAETKISVSSEADIYEKLGLSFIPPELREDRGEIEAAKKHQLPELITLSDIKGDLHSHTNETDGTEPLAVMVKAAINKGYEYLAITDHSKRLAITNGLDEKRLLAQIKQIDEMNATLKNFRILKSIEVDILEDGKLDLSNDVLKELDIVVASVHSKFKLPEAQQTERIIRAMDNPYCNIIGHATGRLINKRNPYPVTMEKLLRAAKERNVAMELNGQPYRLDIHDRFCKMAKDLGVKIAISSDAHSTRELKFMQFGIFQARRGWLSAEDVLNTRSWPELKLLIKK